ACTHRWPLSRAVNIQLDPDETVLGIVSRHWWFLARSTGIALAIIFLAIFLFVRGFWHTFSGLSIDVIAFVSGLIAFAISYLNFADDVFIFTSRRIIDVQRLYFILFSSNVFIEYEKIQEIRFVVPTFWARLLHFGTITISAAGVSGMVLDGVPYPTVLAQAIERNRVEVKRRNDIITANREKQKLKEWFATLLGQMIVVVPDVVGQPLDQAMEEALRIGLRPAVVEVVAQRPGAPAGIVISQNPTAGARALYGGDITFVVRRVP
ncbi:MAG TPA: PASTA domain-containing protein, partial [Ktedonobacterales bacterium]|nr:PASTA domain-containing protein [Ktedonobacterales bacterium]